MTRRVRTPEGADYYNAPIGTPITAAMKASARASSSAKGRAKGDAKAQAAGGGSRPSTGSNQHMGSGKDYKHGGEYHARAKKYDQAIRAARGERDLAAIVNEVQQDSLLDDEDYNKVLDAIEAKHNGKAWKPVAVQGAAPAKKAPAKPAPKGRNPGGLAANRDKMKELAQNAPPKKAAAKKVSPPARKAAPPAAKKPEPKGRVKSKFKGMAMALGLNSSANKAKKDQARERYGDAIERAQRGPELEGIRAAINADPLLDQADKDRLDAHIAAKGKDLKEQAANAPKKKASTDFGELPESADQVVPGIDAADTPATMRQKIDGFRKFIDQANDEPALMHVVEVADRGQLNGDLDDLAAAEIFDAVSARWKEIQAEKKKGPALARDRNKGKRFTRDDTPEIKKAQEAHFAKKTGSIGNAPALGLWNHVRANPDRFEVKENGERGISDNFWVIDKSKVPPETWMFKESFFDGKHKMPNSRYNAPDIQDVFNEQMAAEILKGAGFDMPDTKWASGNGDPSMMAQRHYGEQFTPDGTIVSNASVLMRGKFQPQVLEGMRRGSDPKAPARMAIFDYLINNSGDRHRNNFLMVDEGDGKFRMGIIDQGLAFEGGAYGKSNQTEMSFGDFWRQYRAATTNAGGWSISQAIAAMSGNDRKVLSEQISETLAAFDKVDIEKVKANLAKQTELSRKQVAIAEKWLGEFEWRRAYLSNNIAEMTRIIAQKENM